MSKAERFSKHGVLHSDRKGLWVHAGDFNQKIEQGAAREAALQQRLTAADERIDALTQGDGEQVAMMPVDRSYDVRAKMIIAFNEAKKAGGDLDDALDAAYKSALRYSPNPLTAEQPAPVAAMHPFAEKVIRKLERFQECADDGQGAEIGRHWFDLLTQLGLLNRVQRSPALWEMTQQGEDALEFSRQSTKSR
ncbi:hypothetical protein HX866_11255 [Pseudomonas gingeri]|uniref:hypothetical protein n=1 Tax=Pseudomonas gingeri TaxID=117681 RepID=UPI0015A41B66|nr:hypothetical protein [Pseudomonas gingeri]NWA25473.1 hypothetical protein [Pseudomonas gingeri]